MRQGAALQGGDAEARAEAARVMGQTRTERKAASSRENGKLGGSQIKPLSEVACTCGAGDSLEHRGGCPRYHAIWRRRKKGLPVDLPGAAGAEGGAS